MDPELENLLEETGNMVNELRNYDLEVWAVHLEALKIVCNAANVQALRNLHENIKVRLMSYSN